jgi:hypothetical protein
MNIANDGSPPINFGEYFATQFLPDLAKMAALQAELELRQGALSAVEQTIRLKDDAATALAEAKVKADDLLASAKKKNDASQVRADDIANRETALDAKVQAFENDYAARSQILADAERAAAAKETQLAKREANLNATADALTVTESALNARIKAFQEKVAAISA